MLGFYKDYGKQNGKYHCVTVGHILGLYIGAIEGIRKYIM